MADLMRAVQHAGAGGQALSDPERSVRGYDQLAPVYRWLETMVFGRQLQLARTALLDRLPELRRVLVLGDGDGRLLQAICRAQARAVIVSVDQSAAMLKRQAARVARCGAADRVTFLRGDVCRLDDLLAEQEAFDVIVAAFVTDCFDASRLQAVLPDWCVRLRPGGLFYHVDFVLPAGGWRRWRAQGLSWAMHRFFAWQTGLTHRALVPWPSRAGRWTFEVLHSVTLSGEFIRADLLLPQFGTSRSNG